MRQLNDRRLGGWLLFFVVSNTLGLSINFSTLLSAAAQGAALNPVGVVLLGAMMVCAVLTLVRILQRRPDYLRWFYVQVAFITLTDLYSVVLSGGYSQTVLAALLGVARSAAWIAYFHRSRRVAAYFSVGGPGTPVSPSAARGGCPCCGSEVSGGARFCGKCGARLPKEDER